MKKILLPIIIFFFFSVQAVFAQIGMSKELKLARITTTALSNDLSAFGEIKSIRYESFVLKNVNGKRIEERKQYRSDIDFIRAKNKIEIGFYPGGQKMFRKEVYSFDSDGKLINWDLYEVDGRPTGTKTIFNYDKNGRLVVAAHFLLGSPSYDERFSYPTERQVKVIQRFSRDNIVEQIYKYDAIGNIVEIGFPNGDRVVKQIYTYDQKGNPTSFSTYAAKGKLLGKEIYIYEYDSHSNWIKMTKSEFYPEDGESTLKPVQVTRRTITY